MTPQQSKILEWLEYKAEDGSTVFEMTMQHLGTEARKRISELKRMGYPITSVWQSTNGRHYKKYFIKES